MVQFQSRTGLLLSGRKGDASLDPSVITRGEQKQVNQNMSIAFAGICGPDDTALILEVIAGEIRRGNVSGNKTEFSWTMRSS
jgi:hypothetical protein